MHYVIIGLVVLIGIAVAVWSFWTKPVCPLTAEKQACRDWTKGFTDQLRSRGFFGAPIPAFAKNSFLAKGKYYVSADTYDFAMSELERHGLIVTLLKGGEYKTDGNYPSHLVEYLGNFVALRLSVTPQAVAGEHGQH